MSSSRSESALAACLTFGPAGAPPTEEAVGTRACFGAACFGAAWFSADFVAASLLVVVAIGGIGGMGMGGIATLLLPTLLLPTARDSKRELSLDSMGETLTDRDQLTLLGDVL